MISPETRDLMIRTIYGEGGSQGPRGWIPIAHVMRTRAESGAWGRPNLRNVIMAPKQFSVWNEGNRAGEYARSLKENDPIYQRIGQIVDGVLNGDIDDPTGGATHYYNPTIANPDWGRTGTGVMQIGDHRFMRAGLPAPPPGAGPTPPANIPNLTGRDRMLQFRKQIEAQFPGAHIVSQDRTESHNRRVGGADGSQHIEGTALDIRPSSPEQARQIVEAGLASGGGGFGMYPGGSLHVDFRDGPKQFWGRNYSSSSLGLTPKWFQDTARQHMSTRPEGGAPAPVTAYAPPQAPLPSPITATKGQPVVTGSAGADTMAKAPTYTKGVADDPRSLVSDREIKANNLTPKLVEELMQARAAAQRIQSGAGAPIPQQWGNTAPYPSFEIMGPQGAGAPGAAPGRAPGPAASAAPRAPMPTPRPAAPQVPMPTPRPAGLGGGFPVPPASDPMAPEAYKGAPQGSPYPTIARDQGGPEAPPRQINPVTVMGDTTGGPYPETTYARPGTGVPDTPPQLPQIPEMLKGGGPTASVTAMGDSAGGAYPEPVYDRGPPQAPPVPPILAGGGPTATSTAAGDSAGGAYPEPVYDRPATGFPSIPLSKILDFSKFGISLIEPEAEKPGVPAPGRVTDPMGGVSFGTEPSYPGRTPPPFPTIGSDNTGGRPQGSPWPTVSSDQTGGRPNGEPFPTIGSDQPQQGLPWSMKPPPPSTGMQLPLAPSSQAFNPGGPKAIAGMPGRRPGPQTGMQLPLAQPEQAVQMGGPKMNELGWFGRLFGF